MATRLPTRLAIIGLGEVGCAFGAALRSQHAEIVRVGHDRLQETARQALSLGAVDEIQANLHNAVRDARIILLCLPLHEIQPLITKIGSDLAVGVLVMDTSPAKAVVAGWMREALPQGCAYVGLLPALDLLASPDVSSPEINPLRHMPVFLAAPPGTPAAALETAADLITMAQAQPVFTDIAELDGLAARTFLLPALASAALFKIAAARPGWQEARRTTSRLFAGLAMTNEMLPPESLHLGIFSDKENMLRLLDEYSAALQDLREQITSAQTGAEAAELLSSLEGATGQAVLWKQGRLSNQWDASLVPMPEKQDIFSRWLGFGKKPKK